MFNNFYFCHLFVIDCFFKLPYQLKQGKSPTSKALPGKQKQIIKISTLKFCKDEY